MNPVRNSPIPLFELANTTPDGSGGVAGSAADASVALTSPHSFGDAVRPTWWPRNTPGPLPVPTSDPDDSRGGFAGLIDKLVERLDAIIGRLGRLLGDDDAGTGVRVPGLDTTQPAEGSPSPANYLPAENNSRICFSQTGSYSPTDFAQAGSQAPLQSLQD